MLEATAVRLVVFSTDATAEEFGEAVSVMGLAGVTYSVGWTAWLDIAAEGVTKASGLEVLREKLGHDIEATIAVGDGRNDIEMLTWAGRGVAMGQAPDEVKASADEVTARRGRGRAGHGALGPAGEHRVLSGRGFRAFAHGGARKPPTGPAPSRYLIHSKAYWALVRETGSSAC